MKARKRHVAAANEIHPAWVTLDEASQVLVRVESLVTLIGFSFDAEPHHSYGAEIACDLLKTLKGQLIAAQEQIRPRKKRGAIHARPSR